MGDFKQELIRFMFLKDRSGYCEWNGLERKGGKEEEQWEDPWGTLGSAAWETDQIGLGGRTGAVLRDICQNLSPHPVTLSQHYSWFLRVIARTKPWATALFCREQSKERMKTTVPTGLRGLRGLGLGRARTQQPQAAGSALSSRGGPMPFWQWAGHCHKDPSPI